MAAAASSSHSSSARLTHSSAARVQNLGLSRAGRKLYSGQDAAGLGKMTRGQKGGAQLKPILDHYLSLLLQLLALRQRLLNACAQVHTHPEDPDIETYDCVIITSHNGLG